MMIHNFILYWLTKLQILQKITRHIATTNETFFELNHISFGW